jgi:general secretion pathway protein D
VTVTKTNLLIFIRPTIIRDDAQLMGATAEKYRFIRDQQLQQRKRGVMLLDDERLPIVPDWETQIKQLPEVPADDNGAR